MKVEIIPCLNDNFSYIIHDETTNTVGVVDPSEFKPINDVIERKYKKLDYILNTHHHNDHIGGNRDLKKEYNAKIAASKIDKDKIEGIDFYLDEKKEFNFGNVIFKILFIPGHTLGHIGFYSKTEKVVFTGDTLFSLGCGRIFEGTFDQMFNSIGKIKKLPKDTKIYCGHEYTKNNFEFCKSIDVTNKSLKKKEVWINERIKKGFPTIPVTLKEECSTNVFLRCDDIALKKELKMENSSEVLIFQKLRNLKDEF